METLKKTVTALLIFLVLIGLHIVLSEIWTGLGISVFLKVALSAGITLFGALIMLGIFVVSLLCD